MTTRRGFIKNTIVSVTAIAVCPNILCDEDKAPALYVGDRYPQSIIGEPGDIYSRMDGTNTTLYVHRRWEASSSAEWVAV